jgi:hypothetical protein
MMSRKLPGRIGDVVFLTMLLLILLVVMLLFDALS